ncbi:MAG TPA: S1C family serine protease [Luteolibacter sp.]|nr:S1C family serine protease [Luteolibacter sp.]
MGFLTAGTLCFQCVAADDDRWTVNFQVEGKGVGSTAVALGGPKGPVLVTVALHGGDLSQSAVQLGDRRISAKLAGYDAVSRLCFFRPSDAGAIKAPDWRPNAPIQKGSILTARSGKIEILGKVDGWVNRVGGKILPLALVRVGFGGTIPAPGTPLLDESGKVAAVVFQKGDNENCIYAIPAEAVHRVAKDITGKGRLVRGWLGVSLRVENEAPKIVRIFPGSPAADVGMKEDDLISKIGGRDVSNYAEVANAFFYVVPGEPVDIEVNRGGSVLAFTLMPTGEKPGN